MRAISTIGILLVSISVLCAQEYPRKEVNLEHLADEIFGFQDLDLNYEDLYENLALLLANPANINKTTAEELRFVNILSEEQVQSFLKYREENGNLISLYELQAVPGFDLQTIYRMVPFFIVDDPSASFNASLWKRILKDGNNYFILRYENTLEAKRGFTDAATDNQRFEGNEDKIYMRFRASRPGDYSFGFTVEKDAGEQITWNPSRRQYGFDYNSFHAQVMNKGKIKNLIVGDYQSQFAQGLMLGGNFGFGKGGETITTTRRSNLGFLPYTSINETGYLRGAALTYEVQKNVFISGFYSNTWRDATLANDTTEAAIASSFQTTGLHRNSSELSRRKSLNEQQYGFVLSYSTQNVEGGILYNHLQYNVPIQRNPQPYNQFTFSGQTLTNVGAFLNYNLNNFTWFSEVANTVQGGFGIVTGIIGSLTPRLDVALHFRNYQRNFYSVYSNAFAESSLPQNERGLYWGWKYRWSRKFSLSGYADLFRFPWLRYRNYAPSDGHEFLFRFNYQPARTVLLFIQVREESKTRNISGSESNLYTIAEGVKRNYWINCDYGLGQKLRLKSRAQFSTFSFNGTTTGGMTLLQDISYDFGRLSVVGRYALFDTDDFDNRQYIFERDVWLAYAMPALSGAGIRSYVMLQYDLNKMFTFWIRYARTRFTDRDTIGSGSDTIEGNERNDVKLQMRMKF
jgi:hypothetical protein